MGLTRAVVLALLVLPVVAGAQSVGELIARGRAQMDSTNPDDAVASFEKAVKEYPQNADVHLWLARAIGMVAGNASVLRQPALGRRAKSEFDKAVELDSTSVGGREGLMQFYLRAPGVIGGSVAKAREQAAVIARLNPLRGHYASAAIANTRKDLVGVEKAYRAAATEFPDTLGAITNYAGFLANSGRVDAALALVDKFLEKHPGNIAAQFWIGRTAAATGKQLDRGEQILKGLLARPLDEKGPRVLPENIHFRLGEIAVRRGDKARAKAEFEQALTLNPKHGAAKKALSAL